MILDQQLQIPGAVLKPGSYTFSVEDRMQDRAIVRIDTADKDTDTHYLVLAVPNASLPGQAAQNGLIMFNSKDEKTQVLKGWMCPGCGTGLEFVYPKLEAVKVTGDSGDSVLAVDPESDKLPANLSADDMKVVTLWLLSPKRITPQDKEKGVVAEKYKGGNNVSAPAQTEEASIRPSPSEAVSASANSRNQNQPAQTESVDLAGNHHPTETVPSARIHNRSNAGGNLPKTASNTYSLALWGFLAILAAAALRVTRARVSSRG